MTIHPNLKCVIQILAYQCFFMKKKKALINAKSRNDFFGNTSLLNKQSRVGRPYKKQPAITFSLQLGMHYLHHLHAHYLSSTILSMCMYKKVLLKVNILTDREINVLPKLSLNFSFLSFKKKKKKLFIFVSLKMFVSKNKKFLQKKRRKK